MADLGGADMTATPNTAALEALLMKVEAGAYDRGKGEAKRYSAFYDDLLAAYFCESVSISKLMDAFHNGDIPGIRALIAAPVAENEGGV